jgi:hypothetical protein
MKFTRFYRIWRGIKTRCNNTNVPEYKLYGGRGIKVCDKWVDFINFKKDMYEDYLEHSKNFGEQNTSIDRIDNNKGYSKSNCRWATCREQAKNRHKRGYLEIKPQVQELFKGE